jgi:Domain of unknown function (DUF5911)
MRFERRGALSPGRSRAARYGWPRFFGRIAERPTTGRGDARRREPPPNHAEQVMTRRPAVAEAPDMTPSNRVDGLAQLGQRKVAVPRAGATPQSAAPSPFTPIAQYGFLSNCHTGALVAPDGTVDWLCVPRFDSPSVFGALLDRGAGGFRFGPFGINVPSDRIYEPGTNSLVSSWKTPTGWVVVRDALTMGPRRGEDTVTPHTRPPFDQDADHALVRTASCIDGSVEIDLVCEPAFDYGRIPAEWTLSADRHRAEATGGEQPLQLRTDMLIGIEAGRARARRVLLLFSLLFILYSRNTSESSWLYWAPYVMAAAAFALGIPVYRAQRGRMAAPGDVPPYR